jgi:homoserine dehydrogenase
MTTHAVAESVLEAAVARIGRLPSVLEPPRLLHIAGI